MELLFQKLESLSGWNILHYIGLICMHMCHCDICKYLVREEDVFTTFLSKTIERKHKKVALKKIISMER